MPQSTDRLRDGLAESVPAGETIRALSDLIHDEGAHVGPERLRAWVESMSLADSATLILRLHTASDPIKLWLLHLELDKRGIPPALRWPANVTSPQMEFTTWAADLFWLSKRAPSHRPAFRSWQGLFKHAPGSRGWHGTAHRQFLFVSARYSVAHWCSKGLGLSAAQRQDLMTLATSAMTAARRQLHPERFAEISARLLTHAVSHPDKAGRHDPHAIASRRAAMWRVHILCGRNHAATARRWNLITGDTLSRQAVSKQVAIVAAALRDET